MNNKCGIKEERNENVSIDDSNHRQKEGKVRQLRMASRRLGMQKSITVLADISLNNV